MRCAAKIAVLIAEPGWRSAVPSAAAWARRAARAALQGGRIGAPHAMASGDGGALTVVLGNDAMVRALNRRYRGKDRPTNVLAFANRDGTGAGAKMPFPAFPPLGDVVLALGTVRREARAQGKPVAEHGTHLIIHGVLHLLGYQHGTEAAARDMERLEAAILSRLGIADPYRVRNAGGTGRGGARKSAGGLARG
jgi:probable rRNA maturation factor